MKLTTKKLFVTILAVICCISVSGQNEKKEEKFSGTPIATIFSNFHTGFGTANNDRGFEMERAYLGYQGKVLSNLEYKVVLDLGKSSSVGDIQRLMYAKNAMVTWNAGDLKLNVGLIGMNQFSVQEKFWGKRYLMKSFQDEYKFGSSADLGISGSYSFLPMLSADLTIANGEGYKKLQSKDGLLYGLGVTFKPIEAITVRLYADMNETAVEAEENKYNFAAFAGYKHEAFSLGLEYNSVYNTNYAKDDNQTGFSAYLSVNLSKKFEVFGRWDNLTSKDDWNEENDGNMGVFGVQYKPCKNIAIAPNVRMWAPKSDGSDTNFYGYLSAMFTL